MSDADDNRDDDPDHHEHDREDDGPQCRSVLGSDLAALHERDDPEDQAEQLEEEGGEARDSSKCSPANAEGGRSHSSRDRSVRCDRERLLRL